MKGHIMKRWLVSLSTLSLLLSASTSALAQSKITFTSNQAGADDIWVMDADGANPVNLTNRAAEDFWSRWSPDGSQIAFDSNFGGEDYDIWVMDADGTNPLNLTDSEATDFEPAWSPDGSKIAFWSDRDEGNHNIWLMDADGSNQTRLTEMPGAEENPTWSPDGSKILFNSDNQLHTMDPDGANIQPLLEGVVCCSAWSPDGTKIAYMSTTGSGEDIALWELSVMDADGANPVRLTDNQFFEGVPKWSSDGAMIVFFSDREGAPDIYAMNADGTNTVRLTANPAVVDQLPDWYGPATVAATAVASSSWGFVKQLAIPPSK